MTQLRSQNII